MRMAWPAVLGAVLAAGCQAPVRHGPVSDVVVVGLADLTGRAPNDVRNELRDRIRGMAVEMGLIGDANQAPGSPVHLRGRITGFPPRGKAVTGAGGWIVAGPMTVEWTAMEADGTVLGTQTLSTDPRDAIEVPEDPFVYTQARAVVRWLMSG
jgi:hypothetical protein